MIKRSFNGALFTLLMLCKVVHADTVDKYFTGQLTAATSFVANTQGNLFVSGYGYFDNRICHMLVRKSADQGATWTVVDNFEYSPGAATRTDVYPSITADKKGNVFYCGYAPDASGKGHWIVRKTVDQGTTWKTVDDYQVLLGGATSIAFAPAGGLYVVGWSADSQGGFWVIRKSNNNGASWKTLDGEGTKTYGEANGCAVDSTNVVYAVGRSASGDWMVRKSSDVGTTWQTVDSWKYNDKFSVAQAVICDANNNVYVTGYGDSCWLVRKSSDGGATWNTVDIYQLTPGHISRPRAITVDHEDNLYVAGTSDNRWVVRKSVNEGEDWVTVDLPNGMQTARGIGVDANNDVYPVGMGASHWIVRKLDSK